MPHPRVSELKLRFALALAAAVAMTVANVSPRPSRPPTRLPSTKMGGKDEPGSIFSAAGFEPRGGAEIIPLSCEGRHFSKSFHFHFLLLFCIFWLEYWTRQLELLRNGDWWFDLISILDLSHLRSVIYIDHWCFHWCKVHLYFLERYLCKIIFWSPNLPSNS